MTGAGLDAIARDYITEKGYGQYFGHSLVMVLVWIHSASIMLRMTNQWKLAWLLPMSPVFIEGLGGVRLKTLSSSSSPELLNRSPKELIICSLKLKRRKPQMTQENSHFEPQTVAP